MHHAKNNELNIVLIIQIQNMETNSIAIGKSTTQFFYDLGHRLALRFQDQRENDFLCVFGYSQRERLQHLAVVPLLDADIFYVNDHC